MITISIEKENQNIITIEAKGHSGYAEAGKDIVCAAVSTLTQNLINSLKQVLNIEPGYKIDERTAYLKVTLPTNLNEKQKRECQILMQSTFLGLKNLADSYEKFIKIKEKQLW